MPLTPLPLVGDIGSPYTRKLRAVFRYRHLPYRFIQHGSPESLGLPQPRVPLVPRLIMEEGGALVAKTDTTPLIRDLEELAPNARSVIPADPAIAFLDTLIEDYADEWLTKPMFHYRWAYAEDSDKAAKILPRGAGSQRRDEELDAVGSAFAKRQIDRLWVVGSNDGTRELIEASYERFLLCMENHLREHRFLLGNRPGSGDFGIFGQLTQLALFDPTAVAATLRVSPRSYAWTHLVDDLSGLDPQEEDWFTRESLPDTFRALLAEIGRVYPPFLLANAEAISSQAEEVSCVIDGQRWIQKPFPYQAKCLQWLQRDYQALAAADRAFVDKTLSGTGIESLFN